MKLFSRIKERFSEANKDVINKCSNNKRYLFGNWVTIALFLFELSPYLRELRILKGDKNIIICTIGIGSLIVFAFIQYLDSLIWGLHISEKEFKDFSIQKNAKSYLTYVQRLIFSFGIIFCALSLVNMAFSQLDLFSTTANTVTIMGFGISFLLWMNSAAKEAKQNHNEFKKDERNKKKFDEAFNQILESYKLVNNQLELLNKEIQVIKGKTNKRNKRFYCHKY